MADGFEDDVGAAAAGQGPELFGRIAPIEAHRLGPELGGHGQAIVDAVHGEHAHRTEELRRLHGQEPHRTGAEDRHGVAGTDPAVLGADVARGEDVPAGTFSHRYSAKGTRMRSACPPPQTWPNRPPKTARPVVAHWVGIRLRHHSQKPHEIENGTTTRSPTRRVRTPGPTASTVPMNSCPMTAPTWTSPPPRPWYWWRSEPQTAVERDRLHGSLSPWSLPA